MSDAEPYMAQLYDEGVYIGVQDAEDLPPDPGPSTLREPTALQRAQGELFAIRRELASTKEALRVSQANLQTATTTVANAHEVTPPEMHGATLPTSPTAPLPVSTVSGTKLPIASLSKLSGEDSLKLTDWIADAQLIASLSGATEHQSCVWAVSHTTGQAKQVWRNANIDVNAFSLTFKSLTEILRAGLGIHNDEWEAREKLALLRHTSSLKVYVRQFLALVNQIQSEPLTGSDKVHRFLSGLKPELRRICMLDPSRQNQIWAAEDFEKLVSYALNIETSAYVQPTTDRPTGSPSAKKQKVENRPKPTQPVQPVQSGDGQSTAYLVGWPAEVDKPNKACRAAWKKKCWLCMAMKKPEKMAEKHLFHNCPYRVSGK